MKRIRQFFIIFLVVGIVYPIIFTLLKLGMFAPQPKVQITNKITDENAQTLRVVADFDFAPYSFYDKNNEICGLDVELINEIANQLGMKSQITFTDWQDCKNRLQKNEADLILGLEIFSHMNGVLKTVPASKDELVIFGKEKIHNIAELKDKKVGVMVNSVITKIFDLNCDFIEFYTNTNILEAIDKGEIDFGICHHSVGIKIIEHAGMNLISSISLMNSYPAIGVRDDLPELRDKINNIIIKMSNEGLITKLDEKWINNYTENKSVKDILEREQDFYIVYFIFFIFIFFMFIIILVNSYHREKQYKESLEYQNNLKKQNDILSSIAGVYYTMHIINLKNNTVKEISTTTQVKEYVNKTADAIVQMKAVMTNTVIKEDVAAALEFTDLSTLASRIKDKKTILAEFRGTKIGWFCAQFIPISYVNDEVEEVMFTTQIIDDMKKENERLLKLSSYDELTKLLNRHSYEEKLDSIKENNLSNLTVALFDINELKFTNDNLSHEAGDELIKGAATCLDSVFHNLGNCYRIGGDEFILIVENDLTDLQQHINQLNEKLANWKGKFINEIHMSAGYACSSELTEFNSHNVKSLINLAEKRMYEDKANYYKTTGRERRT